MPEQTNISNKAISGVFWKFLERIGCYAINFIVQIILARILLPEDYGIIAIVTIFLLISDVFIKNGLTTALIQHKDPTQIDYSSVFYSNIIFSLFLYTILYFSAPLISDFFSNSILVSVTRVISISIIIGSIGAVHYARLTRSLNFKKTFIVNLISILVQGCVGIVLAINDFGVWALVYSNLARYMTMLIIVLLIVKWWPSFTFSYVHVRILFRYSSKILGSSLLNTIYNNFQTIVIGKFFTNSMLGYFQRGQVIPQTVMIAVDGSLEEVMYPTYSRMQNEKERMVSALRRTVQVSMYITMPMMAALFMMSEPLTVILLTDKWLKSVPFMQLQCLICIYWPLSSINHAVNAIGKSSVGLKINLISKILTIIFVLLCVPLGAYAIMAASLITTNITLIFISSRFYKKYLGYGLKDICKDILPSIYISVIIASCLYLINLLLEGNNYLIIFSIQALMAVIIYIMWSMISHNNSFDFLYKKLRLILYHK